MEKLSSSRTFDSCWSARCLTTTYSEVSQHERGILSLRLEEDVLGFQVCVWDQLTAGDGRPRNAPRWTMPWSWRYFTAETMVRTMLAASLTISNCRSISTSLLVIASSSADTVEELSTSTQVEDKLRSANRDILAQSSIGRESAHEHSRRGCDLSRRSREAEQCWGDRRRPSSE